MNEETISQNEQLATANRIKEVMSNYGIKTGEVTYTIGPSVTRYKVELLDYKQISKVKKMDSDLTLSMPCCGVRIVMPDTLKECFVYVEIPNDTPEIVSMQSVLDSPRFQEEKDMRLPVALGYTIPNDVFMFDLAEAPHLLIAGATGTGKSVTVNAIIASLLYKKKPSELKFVLVDPKIVEFAPYKPLWNSYLDVFPETNQENSIITECDDLIVKLDALVTEMENRYTLLMDAGARNITMYNEMITSHRLDTDKQVMPNLRITICPILLSS